MRKFKFTAQGTIECLTADEAHLMIKLILHGDPTIAGLKVEVEEAGEETLLKPNSIRQTVG